MLSELSTFLSAFFFFLSGSQVADKSIDRALWEEQLFQLDAEVNLALSGRNRFCNCNLKKNPVSLKETMKLEGLSYFPTSCDESSFELIKQNEPWKGLKVTEISFGRVRPFSDGYLGEIAISIQGPPLDPRPFRKKYPVMFTAEQEGGELKVKCNPVVTSLAEGESEFCVLLDGTHVKCMGQNLRGIIGDSPDEVGVNLKPLPFSPSPIKHLFFAGKSVDENIFCVQHEDYKVECRSYEGEAFRKANSEIHPLEGDQQKSIVDLALNRLVTRNLFVPDKKPLLDYSEILKFTIESNKSIGLNEVNSSPIGTYLNYEDTFLAIFEDGSLGVLSGAGKPNYPLYLPDGVRAKKIVSYSAAEACVLSTEGDVYCWGLFAGLMNIGRIPLEAQKKLMTINDPKQLSLYAEPVKTPVTPELARRLEHVDFGLGVHVRDIKTQYFSRMYLSTPSICATLSDDNFLCFPLTLNQEETLWGQMREFPYLSPEIKMRKVRTLWPNPFTKPKEIDPQPLVYLEDHDFLLSVNGAVTTFPLKQYWDKDLVDIVIDSSIFHALYADGSLIGIQLHINPSDFLRPEDFSETGARNTQKFFLYKFGGPVQKIFNPLNAGQSICAWMFDNKLKCTGVSWAYGDGKIRVNKDPLIGDRFPEIDFGKE